MNKKSPVLPVGDDIVYMFSEDDIEKIEYESDGETVKFLSLKPSTDVKIVNK